jgi:hypothetical protein
VHNCSVLGGTPGPQKASNITVAQTYRAPGHEPADRDVSIKMITEVVLAIMQKDLQEQSGTDARGPFVSHTGVD